MIHCQKEKKSSIGFWSFFDIAGAQLKKGRETNFPNCQPSPFWPSKAKDTLVL